MQFRFDPASLPGHVFEHAGASTDAETDLQNHTFEGSSCEGGSKNGQLCCWPQVQEDTTGRCLSMISFARRDVAPRKKRLRRAAWPSRRVKPRRPPEAAVEVQGRGVRRVARAVGTGVPFGPQLIHHAKVLPSLRRRRFSDYPSTWTLKIR